MAYDQITSDCEKVLKEHAVDFGISIGVTGVIVLLNFLIQETIFFFVRKIRFVSITDLVKNQILMAVWAEFVNTALVVILIYFEFWGFSFIQLFNKILGREFFNVAFIYQDFN